MTCTHEMNGAIEPTRNFTPRSVFEAFQHTTATFPENEFLHVPASGCSSYARGPLSFSYSAAAQEVAHLAMCFAAAGYGPGLRVALLLENRPVFFTHWLAFNSLGVSVVPINPDYRHAEICYILEHSEACLAICIPERVPDLRAAANQIQRKIQILSVENVVNGLDAIEAPRAEHQISLSTECALLYTSGTTGKPKGCMLSNDYYLRMGQRYVSRKGPINVQPGRARVLTPLPQFHMNAMAGSAMGMMISGGCLIQLDRFHPKTWWKDVAATRAIGVHYLGVMPAILLDMPFVPEERQHIVEFGSGANVDPKHHAAFEARFGFPLVEGWAMTETGSGGVVSADLEPRHVGTRCFGKPGPSVELRLVDDEGKDVCPGDPGEIWVRHRGADPRLGFFSGYLKDEEATEAGWAGGWWHTGDVAKAGPDGSLHFVDRKKNIIRRSGENISPLEVETVLQRHPAISQVAVTAVPDAVRGDEVMACIVPSGPADANTAAAIVSWSLEQMAYFKAPGWVAFVPQLPTTATQKIQRGELKQWANRLISEPTAYDLRSMKRRAS